MVSRFTLLGAGGEEVEEFNLLPLQLFPFLVVMVAGITVATIGLGQGFHLSEGGFRTLLKGLDTGAKPDGSLGSWVRVHQ